jgi:hypothetical protein
MESWCSFCRRVVEAPTCRWCGKRISIRLSRLERLDAHLFRGDQVPPATAEPRE